MKPQAPRSETRVTSKYWTDDSTARSRGKSLPAVGNKRAAPECDDPVQRAAEELRRKHAKTFDFIPAEPALEDRVQVKDEPTATTQPPSSPVRPESITTPSTSIGLLPPVASVEPPLLTVPVNPLPANPAPPPVELTSSTTLAKFSSPTVRVKPVCTPSGFDVSAQPQELTSPRTFHEEQAVISTLAHVCDRSVIEATINLVFRWGREVSNSSGEVDDLGIAYYKSIVARIDKRGIEPHRRAVVIDLLSSKYTRHLEDLKKRIGTLSASQLPLPSSPNHNRLVHPNGSLTESGNRNDVLLSRSSVPQGNDGCVAQNGSRHRLEEHIPDFQNIDTDQDTQPSPAKSFASTTTVAASKRTALPKQAFDVFQEAALAARNFTTEEKGEVAKFQTHVKSVWRKVQSCDREEWNELLRIRKTCTDVSVQSHGLLESQGFLGDFVPNYNLGTHLQQPCEAAPSTTGPTGSGMAPR